MRSANGRRRCIATSSIIGWAHKCYVICRVILDSDITGRLYVRFCGHFLQWQWQYSFMILFEGIMKTTASYLISKSRNLVKMCSLRIKIALLCPINRLAPGRYDTYFKFSIWSHRTVAWAHAVKFLLSELYWEEVNICLGSGLVPSGKKPLSEPMLS